MADMNSSPPSKSARLEEPDYTAELAEAKSAKQDAEQKLETAYVAGRTDKYTELLENKRAEAQKTIEWAQQMIAQSKSRSSQAPVRELVLSPKCFRFNSPLIPTT